LVNVSGDPETEYLSDGITESIINLLSQLPNLTKGDPAYFRVSLQGSRSRFENGRT
jgi:hypothetical protein